MKGIILSSVLLASSVSPALADPRVSTSEREAHVSSLRILEREESAARVALLAAHERKVQARARWDAAVAGGHPVAAGIWARRHADALDAYRDAQRRWNFAAARTAALRFASR